MNKLNLRPLRFIPVFLLLCSALFLLNENKAVAQLTEPPVRAVDEPVTPFGQGLRNRIGVGFRLNNFGFGVSGIYSRAVAPFTEITFTAAITGIRDASSQEFIYYFTGRKVVPNRYKRGIGFPLMIGIERRLFPYAIADNFRFFISADAGPSIAFTYPYFNDENNNGYRDTFQRCLITQQGDFCNLGFDERINDFFTGWSEGDWHFGFAGDVSIGVDLGSDIGGGQATFEIGYFFYYYPDGLQLMEPFKKTGYEVIGQQNNVEIRVDRGQEAFYKKQSFFGSPQIKFTYSWWL